jgi:hypothetical protein
MRLLLAAYPLIKKEEDDATLKALEEHVPEPVI